MIKSAVVAEVLRSFTEVKVIIPQCENLQKFKHQNVLKAQTVRRIMSIMLLNSDY